ncbi:hypothetical protein V6Z11_A01G001100 [Gossypium hirsutum]
MNNHKQECSGWINDIQYQLGGATSLVLNLGGLASEASQNPPVFMGKWPNTSFSHRFLTLTVLSYISFTFVLSQLSRPSLSRPLFKSITAVDNIFLLTLSFTMALGCLASNFSQVPNFKNLVCFPRGTSPSGPLFFWAYIFYLSKIVEFIDTLLIILSGSMKRLSFIHGYHHSMVVIMCYICLESAQSSVPMVLVTNCVVHVVMYTYYLLCTLGMHPKWKKIVTDFQLVQFRLSFLIMAVVVFYHFTASGCSGILSW